MKLLQKNSKFLFVISALCWIIFNLSLVVAEENKEDNKEQNAQQKYVSIDFNDVDIRIFIKFISELTNKNFIVDNRVKGTVNIISPGKITKQEAYKVFESVLEVNGFTVVKAGEISKIIPMQMATSKNVETRFEKGYGGTGDKIVTQLIPLKYADTNEIKRLFVPLVSKTSVILAYAPTNTLIITDVYSNINRLVKIITAIDVKDVGQQISVIPVSYADALKLGKTLNTLFQTKTAKGKKTALDQMVKIIPDERTNTLVLLANEFDTVKVKELVEIMDKQVPKSDSKIRVFYLENANAEELATVLQSLSGKASVQEKGKKTAPVVSDTVKITADKATNSLIIMAEKDDYPVLETIIQKLDIPRPMVYIEALIMEIRDTDDFMLGVEWMAGMSAGSVDGNDAGVYGAFTSESSSNGISALPTITNNILNVPGGFALGIMAENITIGGISFPNLGAAIRAMKKNEKVQIISTPQIMTTDNEEAEISVGENIPYKTTSGSGDQNYENFEYKDVGVTLKITPQISQGRFVRLNIYQKVEKVASTEENTPTTLKRTAQTTVVVKDAATVVIGGLIGEDLTSTDYKVPCLGDIPFAGNLFKSTGRKGVKTNLYIFLTPHIIENPVEAETVYREKHKEISKVKENTIKLYKDKK
ncbi:type II secretion system secretin GspD [Desulfobacula phenolica]|uniref:General secretion pathway protein D n=1 Tax=Desulfobacula phenolica TaxID=90732 RepID=A0A1H2DP34_9BACT|nr:type II secretion system secretin GspD [Desulfobacula phenolica]SDT84609.1 general secretion pathway protein D [Desulfobacula phenolica]